MLVTLLHDIIVNDGKRGIPRKKGESVEVRDGDAALLILNNQAEKYTGKKEK